MVRTVILGVVTFAVWLLWSGIYEPLILGLGVVSCLLVVLICRPMNLFDEEGVPFHIAIGLITYIPWLTLAIVKSNIDVALRILNPRLPISPRLIRARAGQQSELGRVVYANSITLTPGTVTCQVDGDEFVVHALTREAADEVTEGAMDRRVSDLEGAPKTSGQS
ncbi:MAG TPA: Na+/H+ antiporter subunit E [Candidatus Latescibacteria bacterium]|nr:Na+/H+ antiporter subunit E [Candidatus Latescibacterota bacterium]HJP32479.1 Na+/H+ antiporter subunit E [Candidatus Latescibacterota bacterium]